MQPHYVFLGKGHTAGGRKGKRWALEAGRVLSRTMQTVQIVHIPQLQYQVTQKTATVSFSTLAIAYMAVLSSTVISRPKASFSEGLEQPDIATAVYGGNATTLVWRQPLVATSRATLCSPELQSCELPTVSTAQVHSAVTTRVYDKDLEAQGKDLSPTSSGQDSMRLF